MKSAPDLLIMAAGLGSRYGGLKQMDVIGPFGECLMEYSIHDAKKAGFGRVVFIIKREIEKDFNDKILSKIEKLIPFKVVFQENNEIIDRKKPLGTGHAILSAKNIIDRPFAVINADDFYGADAFRIMKDYLVNVEVESSDFCLLGYQLKNTLSKNGYVSRGVCKVEDSFLKEISEFKEISISNNLPVYKKGDSNLELNPMSLVSMNFWGFTSSVFNLLEERFKVFIKENPKSETAEFMIPKVIDYAIKNNVAKVKVLETIEKWMGVTFPEDKQTVINGISDLIKEGEYPENLNLF